MIDNEKLLSRLKAVIKMIEERHKEVNPENDLQGITRLSDIIIMSTLSLIVLALKD